MEKDMTTGREFGLAVCKLLKLNPDECIGVELKSEHNEILHVEIKMTVNADDLAAIADMMKTKQDEWAAPLAVAKQSDYRPTNARRAHGPAPSHAPAQPMADSMEKGKP